jgi:hypothetical protein
MRIFMDQNACDVQAGSVSQALAGAAAVARERGRAIVDVVIDGRHCAANQLDHATLRTSSASEIRLTTADCRQLVRQAFDDAASALSEADRLQQSAAELIQADRAPQAMEQLAQALEIWSNVRAAVLMGTEMAGIDLYAEAGSDGQRAGGNQAIVTALSEQLRSLRAALTSNDIVAVSDTLLYDLPGVVTAWRGMLCDLQKRVGDERGTSSEKTRTRAKPKRQQT